MINIAIYSRKSRWSDTGESIQNQIQLCKEYGHQHFQVDQFFVYQDHGYSGRNTQRPRYKELLNDLPKGKFHLLICYRLDRISRNILDFSNLVENLQKYEIDFVSIRESFDTSTPMGRAMMYISSVFAQLERETIAERIRDNMHQLARSGRWLGGRTPLGFDSRETTYPDEHHVRRKAYELMPIKEELRIVSTLYERYLKHPSLNKLADWTRENHVYTRAGKTFDKSSLKFILSNPVYAQGDKSLYDYFKGKNADLASPMEKFDGLHGLMVFNKHDEGGKNKILRRDASQWIIAIARHRGIIPSEAWIQTQHLLEQNSQLAPRQGTGRYGLITEFLRCGHCGSKMRISIHRRSSKVYYYYKCTLKEISKGADCSISNLNGKKADQRILAALQRVPLDKNLLLQEIQRQSHSHGQSCHPAMNQRKDLENQRNKYQEGINNLTSQLAASSDSEAGKYLIHRMEEWIRKIKEIDCRLENLEKEEEQPLTPSILPSLLDFWEDMTQLSFDEKKMLLKGCVDDILWDGKALTLKFLE